MLKIIHLSFHHLWRFRYETHRHLTDVFACTRTRKRTSHDKRQSMKQKTHGWVSKISKIITRQTLSFISTYSIALVPLRPQREHSKNKQTNNELLISHLNILEVIRIPTYVHVHSAFTFNALLFYFRCAWFAFTVFFTQSAESCRVVSHLSVAYVFALQCNFVTLSLA